MSCNTYCSGGVEPSVVQTPGLLAPCATFVVFLRHTSTIQPADGGRGRRAVFNDAVRSTVGVPAALTGRTRVPLELLSSRVRHVAMDTRDVSRRSE